MARRRTLRPEEEEIWQAVARTAKPMHPGSHVFLKPVEAPVHPVPFQPETVPPHAAQPRLPAFRLGEKARAKPTHDLVPTLAESLASAPLQMDAKTHGKMTKGKLTPEARIDLHGLTLSEAHPELIGFILNAQSAGMRLVLVITGKGNQRLLWLPRLMSRTGVVIAMGDRWKAVVDQVAAARKAHPAA